MLRRGDANEYPSFNGEIRKVIPQLSPNTLLICSTELYTDKKEVGQNLYMKKKYSMETQANSVILFNKLKQIIKDPFYKANTHLL